MSDLVEIETIIDIDGYWFICPLCRRMKARERARIESHLRLRHKAKAQPPRGEE